MIFTYNPEHVGDVLMVILGPTHDLEVDSERVDDIARIFIKETNETVGLNFFEIKSVLPNIEGKGQVSLTDADIETLNQSLKAVGFAETLENPTRPHFVVGFVKEMEDHPDSDHLHITQTEIDNGEVLQIVCGAANVAQGQKVVVATVGSMMPDGSMIWAGSLRGVESFGMICSARELALPNAPEEKGILVLDDNIETGTPFSPSLAV